MQVTNNCNSPYEVPLRDGTSAVVAAFSTETLDPTDEFIAMAVGPAWTIGPDPEPEPTPEPTPASVKKDADKKTAGKK